MRNFSSALLCVLIAAGTTFAAKNDDLANFLSAFSQNFARANHKALVTATAVRFPLRLKGTLDDSPEVKLGEKAFAKVLAKISQQPSGLNAANLNETEAEHLLSQVKAGKLPEDAGEGTRRSGNLVFKKKDKVWQLVKVYVSDELIDSLQKKGK